MSTLLSSSRVPPAELAPVPNIRLHVARRTSNCTSDQRSVRREVEARGWEEGAHNRALDSGPKEAAAPTPPGPAPEGPQFRVQDAFFPALVRRMICVTARQAALARSRRSSTR